MTEEKDKVEIKPIEPLIPKALHAYMVMYNECVKRIEALMGIIASQMGSEQGRSGGINRGRHESRHE